VTDQSESTFRSADASLDADALSELDTQMLQSMGFWPRMATSHSPGSPYISEFGDSRSLHFDHRTIQSSMSMSDPLSLEFDYIRVMMGFLLFNPRPQIIDMIGLGGGSLAKYCYYKVPSSFITAVEISREVIALRSRFFIPEDNRRLRVLCGDGADYVRQNKRQSDVLLVDGFDADGQPPQLCTQSFYDDCYDHLAAGGMLVANLWEKHSLCIGRLRKTFGHNLVVVHTECGDNRAVFAWKGTDRTFAPDYGEVASVHGERHVGFLPQVAERIDRQLARRDLLRKVQQAVSPRFPCDDAAG
jgi:spermidine synthase